MKGLILKDFYLTIRYCKAIMLLDLVFIAIYLFQKENLFFLFYPCVFAGLLPITLLSCDEREKWDSYAGTLPCTRAQLVSEKYLISLFGGLIVLLLCGAAQAFRMISKGAFLPMEYLGVIMTLAGISFVVPTVLYPFIFRFGTTKGRVLYYILIALACAFGSVFFGDHPGIAAETGYRNLTMIIAGAVIILYGMSWLLSIRFYQKRDL